MGLRVSVAVLWLVLVAAGCGGGGRPLHASAEREHAWVSRLQQWLTVEAFQGNFRNCATRVARDVGPAPARDLAAIERDLDRLCSRFDDAYRDVDGAFKHHDAERYERSRHEIGRAEASVTPLRNRVDAWHPGSSPADLPRRGGNTEVSRVEPRLSAAASALAGSPVEIRCWSQDDWGRVVDDARSGGIRGIVDLSGLADPTADHADLSPEICRDLVNTTYRGDHTGVRAAVGLTVLAHEATHLRGDDGPLEAVTECYAMQRVPIVAAKLGVSRSEARTLARLYFTDVYPENLPEYRTAGCHDNGEFDLHPLDPVWP